MGVNIHLIVYMSEALIPADKVDEALEDIVKLSRKQNRGHRITGVLFYVQGRFMQIIEGPERQLRQLMANIEKDPRHQDIRYLIDEPVFARGFKKWNMQAFRLGNGKTFDFQTLQEITTNFKKELIPRSDLLVVYYKALLKEQSAHATL